MQGGQGEGVAVFQCGAPPIIPRLSPRIKPRGRRSRYLVKRAARERAVRRRAVGGAVRR